MPKKGVTYENVSLSELPGPGDPGVWGLDGLERQHGCSPAAAGLYAYAHRHAFTHPHADASNADGHAPITDDHADFDATTGHNTATPGDAAAGRTDARGA